MKPIGSIKMVLGAMSSRIRFATRSLSVKSVPNCSLNVLMALLRRSSSGSILACSSRGPGCVR
jgi:hypothetical protein